MNPVDIVSLIFVSVCAIFMLVCIIALLITGLGDKKLLFQVLYLYFFDREEYNLYKLIKDTLKKGGTFPIISPWTDFRVRKGICFITSVHKDVYSVYQDGECKLVYGFHKPILDYFMTIGDFGETIKQERTLHKEEWKEINRRLEDGKKELARLKAEYKEKFGVDYDEEHPN